MSKQVSLPKISSILQKMKISQNSIYALFAQSPSIKQYLHSILDVSTDTDAFMLPPRRLPELCQNTSFVPGKGQRHHKIFLRPIVQALRPARTAALPEFHAWRGADITGSFASKGKLGCWKAFLEADKDSVIALANLGTTVQPTSSIHWEVSLLYQPKTHISRVKIWDDCCSEEASLIGKTTSNTSCFEGSHIASTLPGNGIRAQSLFLALGAPVRPGVI